MLRDPFTAEDEVSLYIPREASEAALATLERCVREAGGDAATRVSVLLGPVGIGKSLLLKVLENRVAADVCCVRVEYPGSSVTEFCQWILRELDARETLEGERALQRPALARFREWMQRERSYAATDDPEQSLVQLATEFQGRGFPIVVLVDNADGLKPEAASRLRELSARAGGGLCLVLALTDGTGEQAMIDALGSAAITVHYDTPMTLDETIVYLKERLARAQASPELLACLDESRVRRIYKYTQGNPRRLHGEVGLIHLELSRVRAGISVRAPDAAPAPSPLGPVSRAGGGTPSSGGGEIDWDAVLAPLNAASAAGNATVSPTAAPEPRAAEGAVAASAPEPVPIAHAPEPEASGAAPEPQDDPEPAQPEVEVPAPSPHAEAAQAPPGSYEIGASPAAEAAVAPTADEEAEADATRPLRSWMRSPGKKSVSGRARAGRFTRLWEVAASDGGLLPNDPSQKADATQPAPDEDAHAAAAEEPTSAPQEPELALPPEEAPCRETPAVEAAPREATGSAESAAERSGDVSPIAAVEPLENEERTLEAEAPATESSEEGVATPTIEIEIETESVGAPSTETAAATAGAAEATSTSIEAEPAGTDRSEPPVESEVRDEPVRREVAAEAEPPPPVRLIAPEDPPEALEQAQQEFERLASSSTRLADVELPATPAEQPSSEPLVAQTAADELPDLPPMDPEPTPWAGTRTPWLVATWLVVPSLILLGGFSMWSASGDADLPQVEARPVEPQVEPGLGPIAGEVRGLSEPTGTTPVELPAEVPAPPPVRMVLTNINAKPYATIEVDGRVLGETPLGDMPLSAGPHVFRATMPDGRKIERTEMIGPDNNRIVFE